MERDAIERFRLRRASFKGQGLYPDLSFADWGKVSERAFENSGLPVSGPVTEPRPDCEFHVDAERS